MNLREAQAGLQAAETAHANAKQAFFDEPTDDNAGKVSKAELLIERAQMELERAQAAEANRPEWLAEFTRLQAERAAGEARCAAISAELVELERKARVLLFELVEVASAQRDGYFRAKPLSLKLDQPKPLLPPADIADRRIAIQADIWRAHRADGVDSHPFRHAVSEWLQTPARPPLGDPIGSLNARPTS
jgi:hypothetical protein